MLSYRFASLLRHYDSGYDETETGFIYAHLPSAPLPVCFYHVDYHIVQIEAAAIPQLRRVSIIIVQTSRLKRRLYCCTTTPLLHAVVSAQQLSFTTSAIQKCTLPYG